MIFVGSFETVYFGKWIVVLAVLGVVLTAGYILRMVQRMFLGQFNTKWENITEINGREVFTLVPLVLLTLAIGIYPTVLNVFLKDTVNNLVKLITG